LYGFGFWAKVNEKKSYLGRKDKCSMKIHELRHTGTLVHSGAKYVLRTGVMFRWKIEDDKNNIMQSPLTFQV